MIRSVEAANATRVIDPAAVYPIYTGSGELSPFHDCYATDDIVLRIAAGRFYANDNGDDHAVRDRCVTVL